MAFPILGVGNMPSPIAQAQLHGTGTPPLGYGSPEIVICYMEMNEDELVIYHAL